MKSSQFFVGAASSRDELFEADHVEYKDLGQDYFDKLNSKRLVPYLVKRLKNMGYEVNLVPLESAA